jgi:hypothetical protein
VLAVGNRLQAMMDTGARHAGRLHDHLDAWIGNKRGGAVGDECAALLMRIVERLGGILAFRPAGGLELAARAAHVEVGDAGDMHAMRQPRLRQEHGAELAGTDDADGDRPPGGRAFKKLGIKVHAAYSAFDWRMILSENRFPLFGIMR